VCRGLRELWACGGAKACVWWRRAGVLRFCVRSPPSLPLRPNVSAPLRSPHPHPRAHYHQHHRLQLTVADFDVTRRLGEGSFSTVILARYRADRRQYAVKMINKSLVVRNKVRLLGWLVVLLPRRGCVLCCLNNGVEYR